MFEREVLTRIDIDSSPESVWAVLSDLDSYPQWNPMIRTAAGDLEEGNRLRLRFEPRGGRGRTFRPRLMVVEPGRELRWKGNPGVPVMLESEHYFRLERKPDGNTVLVHNMVFYGILAPLLFGKLEASVLGPFEEMNRALKARAESLGRGSHQGS